MRLRLLTLTLLTACGGSDISVKAAGEAICNGVKDEEETIVDGPFDADGDGYFNADNPGCADTYPPEDLDCDDSDPEVGGGIEWYPDEDGDGFGADGETLISCEPELGFSGSADDCDDTRGSVYPGADEYCDEIDNDCDDIVDENPVDGLTYYRDADGDGYGSEDDTQQSCDTPTGYSPSLGDCDDANASLNPGEEEECFDDKDNNCDGEVDNVDADGDGWIDEGCGGNDCDDNDNDTSPDADVLEFWSGPNGTGELLLTFAGQGGTSSPNFFVDRFIGGHVTGTSAIQSGVYQNNTGQIELDEFIFAADEGFFDPGGQGNPIQGVPEPGAIALLGIGLAGLGLMRRQRRAAAPR